MSKIFKIGGAIAAIGLLIFSLSGLYLGLTEPAILSGGYFLFSIILGVPAILILRWAAKTTESVKPFSKKRMCIYCKNIIDDYLAYCPQCGKKQPDGRLEVETEK